MCLRFNEWGRAVWMLQKEFLTTREDAGKHNWYFTAYAHNDDIDLGPVEKHIAGLVNSVTGL